MSAGWIEFCIIMSYVALLCWIVYEHNKSKKQTTMVELSIEEKAKRYDEAIKKFDVILNLNTVKESGTIFTDDVRKILSELAESEDEKIRKAIIKIVKKDEERIGVNAHLRKLQWLEKQGEKGTNGNEREIPNSAWSEEDERKLNDVIRIIENSGNVQSIREHYASWLKTLKPQKQWKPTKEQLIALEGTVDYLNESNNEDYEVMYSLLEQLKKL